MGLRERFGRRVETLPRSRPEPEPNKIQSPELVRALQQRLGLRQSHVVPTMAADLQAVIIADDLTAKQALPVARYTAFVQTQNDAASDSVQFLWNPPGSGKILRLIRTIWAADTAGGMECHLNFVLGLNNTPPPQDVGFKFGKLHMAGQRPQDLASFPAQSDIKLTSSGDTVVGAGTYAEMWITFAAGPFKYEHDGLLIGPGAIWECFIHSPNNLGHMHAVWEEIPLT